MGLLCLVAFLVLECRRLKKEKEKEAPAKSFAEEFDWELGRPMVKERDGGKGEH